MSSLSGNYPVHSGFDYLSELQAQTLNEISRNSAAPVTRSRPLYGRIHVLLCSWTDDPRNEQEYAEVQDAFRNTLHGIVETCSIPRQDALSTLTHKISDEIHKARSVGYNLVILYYTGGSELVNGRFVLSPKISKVGPVQHIPWDEVQRSLEAASVDVLMVMDCLYEGRKEGHGVYGSKEIIAATEELRNGPTEARLSFSQSLCSALASLKSQNFTTNHLYETICSCRPRYQPVHVILSSHKENAMLLSTMPSMKEQPRSAKHLERDMKFNVHLRNLPAVSDPVSTVGNWIESTMPVRWNREKVESNSDEQLSFSYSGAPSVANDPQKWGDMARNAPANVQRALQDVRVEVTYEPDPHQTEDKANTTSPQIAELVDSLNINMEIKNNLTRNGHYHNVAVLPIMFEAVEPEFGLEGDVEDLRQCFTNRFNFRVYGIFKIPSRGNPQEALFRRIIELTAAHGKREELIIIVYAGHGVNPAGIGQGMPIHMGPAIWAPRQQCGYHETVDWSKIQGFLEMAPCDTLTILNCCYAGNAALHSMNGTNEILAASDRDTMAYPLDHSFLRVLVQVLDRLGPSKVSIDKLKDELDKYNTIAERKKINHPFHKRYPSSDHPSIQLQPLPTSASVSRRATDSIQDAPDSSFYIKVSLDSLDNVPKSEWATFFANARYPSFVRSLQFYSTESLLDHLKDANINSRRN